MFEIARSLFVEGLAYIDASDFANAEQRFREALKHVPTSVPVLSNLSLALFAQGRFSDSRLVSERAIKEDERNIDARLNIANCLLQECDYAAALAAYDQVIALAPARGDARVNRAVVLNKLGRPMEAIAEADRAIASMPDSAEAHYTRGLALKNVGRHDDALASQAKALALRPNLAKAHVARGNIFTDLKRPIEAAEAYGKAVAIDPALPEVQGGALHARMQCCDWKSFDADCARLIDAARRGRPVASPFVMVTLPVTPADQLQVARGFVARTAPAAAQPLWRGEIYAHERPRIAYVSADFHDHATAQLMAGLFERHDRTRFATYALSFGPDDGSAMRKRLTNAFDHFIDVGARSDAEIARLIRELEIDIAIDLKGFTQDSRPGIFALRPAPVQVNYLGYPSTMGADYIDYIVADRTVIPAAHEADYAERVVTLPHSYQPNDRTRRIAERTPNRREAGLPDSGFVFCSFNNSYKITPEVFDVWMRLLREVEGGVLWLLSANDAVPVNLRAEAGKRGVAPERLIFAPRAAQGEHLARQRLADLFLDTLPCNAHTTASDALWAGLPVLTCLGETFAGRVAASLLRAAGLDELVTHSLAGYETMALALARDGGHLAALKARLAATRDTCPLFDTGRLTRDLEAAYAVMAERHRRGEPKAAFAIPG